MSRSSRIASLAPALALVAMHPSPASASEAAPTISRGFSANAGVDKISQYFAGYIDPVGPTAAVTARITVPTLDCGPTDEGIGTYAEFANDGGFQYVGAAVYSYCFSGVGTHVAAVQSFAYGLFYLDGPVSDGDKIVLSTREVDGGVEARVRNVTQNWAEKRVFAESPQPEANIVQNVIGLNGAIAPPLSEDTRIGRARIGGETLQSVDPTKLVLVDIGVDPEIKPTRIRNETNFTFKYVADQP